MPTPECHKICYRNIELKRKNTERYIRSKMQNSKRTDINWKKKIVANQKQYRDTNKEKIRARAKEYKKIIIVKSEKQTEKTITCDNCGTV